jgi:hypothetical protein
MTLMPGVASKARKSIIIYRNGLRGTPEKEDINVNEIIGFEEVTPCKLKGP